MGMKATRVLIINEQVKSDIFLALQFARANPNKVSDVMAIAMGPEHRGELKLSDRKLGTEPLNSYTVHIADGYRCNIGFEEQPSGLFRHLSVSVDEGEGGALPNPVAVETLCKEFGFEQFPPEKGTFWVEEFTPGCRAINIVELVDE